MNIFHGMSLLGQFSFKRLGRFIGNIEKTNLATLQGKVPGNRFPDTATASCDDDGFPSQTRVGRD